MSTTPRVRAFNEADNAPAMYRIWMPFAMLRERGWDAEWVPPEEFNPGILDKTDILVLPRIAIPKADLERLRADATARRVALVWETDDDLWTVEPESPHYVHITPYTDSMRATLRMCEAATCTNAWLAERIKKEAGRPMPTFVLPNCVYLPMWEDIHLVRKDPQLTVGVHGGASHSTDWEVLGEAWHLVGQRYPEVRFLAAGFCPDYLKAAVPQDRLTQVGWVPIEEYPQAIAQMDIACAPLRSSVFNRSKSNIKLMESGLAGAAAVVSETVYGADARAHGLAEVIPLAQDRNPEAWARAIGKLIEQPQRRRQLADRAAAWARSERDIKKRVSLWENAYRQIAARAAAGTARVPSPATA